MKGLPFPAKAAMPALAETSTISAKGENGLWDDDDIKDRSSRARRELSVIDESTSLAQRDEDVVEDGADDGLVERAEARSESLEDEESKDDGDPVVGIGEAEPVISSGGAPSDEHKAPEVSDLPPDEHKPTGSERDHVTPTIIVT